MKTMTCRQLGGACDQVFRAASFEEVAALSKRHGMEMFRRHDEAHLKAMQQMRALLQQPEAMGRWLEDMKKAFEALPEDSRGT
ncbi:DUF1059 domain-containing protein [Acidihalobacter yilgarnensis]|uniref:DUF1059 domain-containing protein n=1 Tax=Acidihalobacter yilgarnensis TaxID=2819280 RepID=A0A1D8IMC3_9GAMM|nr:DUF1059 domain-containing protein [Acidihalobacter yilgarnensis]AOU97622.1 DUF1059 domain-containing protein [Acidihalobacter yilgarnensis]